MYSASDIEIMIAHEDTDTPTRYSRKEDAIASLGDVLGDYVADYDIDTLADLVIDRGYVNGEFVFWIAAEPAEFWAAAERAEK